MRHYENTLAPGHEARDALSDFEPGDKRAHARYLTAFTFPKKAAWDTGLTLYLSWRLTSAQRTLHGHGRRGQTGGARTAEVMLHRHVGNNGAHSTHHWLPRGNSMYLHSPAVGVHDPWSWARGQVARG